MEKLILRLNHDFREGKLDSNRGFLEELPYTVMRNISHSMHEIARKASGIEPGVRAYKRNIAPLVAIVSLQSYENFGFILYRTSYHNDTAWEYFMDVLENMMTNQMSSNWDGHGFAEIKGNFLLPIEDDVTLDGGAEDCRARWN